MNIYEMHGRMAEKLETEQAAHRSTVGVLIALKAGALRLDQVDVDAGALSWATFPDRAPPAAPAAPQLAVETTGTNEIKA